MIARQAQWIRLRAAMRALVAPAMFRALGEPSLCPGVGRPDPLAHRRYALPDRDQAGGCSSTPARRP